MDKETTLEETISSLCQECNGAEDPVSTFVNDNFPPRTTNIRQRQRAAKTIRNLGIAEFILGLSTMIISIVVRVRFPIIFESMPYMYDQVADNGLFHQPFFISTGIWAGVFIIITGIVGITSTVTNPHYDTNIAWSAMSTLVSLDAGIISAILASFSIRSVTLMVLYSTISILTFVSSAVTIFHAVGCLTVRRNRQEMKDKKPKRIHPVNPPGMPVCKSTIYKQSLPMSIPSVLQSQSDTTALI